MSSALDGTAITEISNLAQRKPLELAGLIVRPNDWVAEDPNALKKPEPAHPKPKCAVIEVATLGALRDYLKTNRDALKLDTLTVHVESPSRVTLGSALREP